MPSLGVSLRHAALAAFTTLLAACAGAPTGGPTAKLALVIGNAAYKNATVLHAPVNDANDMCAALRRVGFRTQCHTNVRDRDEFDTLVREYVDQLGPSSVGVFYYSGHGVQAGSANFLIPTEVQLKTGAEDPLRVLYGVDALFDRLRQKPTRFQVVILDACRTDIFTPAPRHAGRESNTPPRSKLVDSLEAVAGARNGLTPITDAPARTMVLYATASKNAAFDGGEERNSPLTKHVLAHIGTKGLPVTEFFRRVTFGVENETALKYDSPQTPFIYGSFSGNFCFAGCPGEVDVPPAF